MSEHIYEDSDMENERYHVIPFGSMHEEIVRCKDCKCFDEETSLCNRLGKFPEWHACTEPDGFCKWGERESE